MDLAATTDLLQLFADPTRVRMAVLLARHELTVAELVEVLGTAQSRVSTHLARLRAARLTSERRGGSATYHRLAVDRAPASTRAVLAALQADLTDAVLDADHARAEAAVRARTRGWPDAVAGQMERHYSPGRTYEALARGLLTLLDLGDVLDAGSGDGTVAQMLAPHCRSVTALDHNPRMVDAARTRLSSVQAAQVVAGDVEALPFAAPRFDTVLLWNVLTDTPTPARAVAEAARVLRPGGVLSIITLAAHRHLPLAAPYGHRHAGFAPAQLRRQLTRAGLSVVQCEATSREKRPPHFHVLTALARKAPPTEGRHVRS